MSSKPFFQEEFKGLIKALVNEVVREALIDNSLKILIFQGFAGILWQTEVRKRREKVALFS